MPSKGSHNCNGENEKIFIQLKNTEFFFFTSQVTETHTSQNSVGLIAKVCTVVSFLRKLFFPALINDSFCLVQEAEYERLV